MKQKKAGKDLISGGDVGLVIHKGEERPKETWWLRSYYICTVNKT